MGIPCTKPSAAELDLSEGSGGELSGPLTHRQLDDFQEIPMFQNWKAGIWILKLT